MDLREKNKMAEENKIQEMQKTIILLQEELERIKSPPFLSGTILEIGKKAARISLDGAGGIYEIPFDENLREKVKRGSRVVLNPMTKAVTDLSEFSFSGGEVVTVDEVLGNRLRVTHKGEFYVVLNSLEEVKVGDEVVLDPSKSLAVERFSRKKSKYALEEVPLAPWTNIGGLEGTIEKIKQEIEEPFIHENIFTKYGRRPAKGILLYGPPGCGKTMIAKSIAYNLARLNKSKGSGTNGHFIKVNGPEILEKWVGNSEANIRRIYEAARETASENGSPVIVFIDEAESILKRRGSGISTDVYDSIVPQFLSEMDGLNGHYNVITVLATNREDIIDPAILRDGRVDRRIKVSRPSQEGAKEIFQIYLKDKPLQAGILGFGRTDPEKVSTRIVEEIYDEKNVAYTVVHPVEGVLGNFYYRDLMSGALIKGVVDRASTYAIQREINGGKSGISQEDIERSVREEFMEHAGFSQTLVKEDWQERFGSQGRKYQRACEQGYLVLETMVGQKPKEEQIKWDRL
jgi:proteasome-associated ATPase